MFVDTYNFIILLMQFSYFKIMYIPLLLNSDDIRNKKLFFKWEYLEEATVQI